MEKEDSAEKKRKQGKAGARRALAALRQQIEATENGKVRAPGLGVFIVKTTTREAEGHSITRRRVVLRMGGRGRSRGNLENTPLPATPYPPLPANPPTEET